MRPAAALRLRGAHKVRARVAVYDEACPILGCEARSAAPTLNTRIPAFNRTIMSAGLATALIVVLLTLGGHLLAIDPNLLAILYLLSFGSTFLIGAISFDPRLGVAAATCLAGFIIASAWPPSFLPTIILAYLIGAISYFFVVASRWRLARNRAAPRALRPVA